MRRKTVRIGLKFMVAGILCVMIATFFPGVLAGLLFLGIGGEASVTFAGFLLGGFCGGFGVLVSALGLLQGGGDEKGVRLAPTILLLLSLVLLFFFFTYNSLTAVHAPSLPRGESIDI